MRRLLILTVLFVLSLYGFFVLKEKNFYESQELLMGTVVSQKVYGVHAKEAVAKASFRLKELEGLLSFHIPESELSRFNRHAGMGKMKLSPELFFLFKKSLAYSAATGGAFNILVGPLVKCWKVTAENADVPTQKEIDALLPLIFYEDLVLEEKERAASLNKKGQMADLGGIAKGYASDEVIAIYKQLGIRSAIIDIGGNIGLLGKNPQGRPWTVGIQDPLKPRGEYLGFLDLTDKALSTSGAYERFFEKNGKIYHHIIDPATGYPSDSGLLSASIIADHSVESDAFSKIFVMGAEKGIAVIKRFPGTEAILVTRDKKIIATSGLKEIFHSVEENGYELVFV